MDKIGQGNGNRKANIADVFSFKWGKYGQDYDGSKQDGG
jgi:hypothetical protein